MIQTYELNHNLKDSEARTCIVTTRSHLLDQCKEEMRIRTAELKIQKSIWGADIPKADVYVIDESDDAVTQDLLTIDKNQTQGQANLVSAKVYFISASLNRYA